jgi:Kef-type K+ transport system membrane component KefB
MDVMKEAQRLASLATVFVWLGWLAIVWALVAGVLWWIDMASKDAFNFIEAFALSSAAIAGPLMLGIVVASLGHTIRLFAMYVASRSA